MKNKMKYTRCAYDGVRRCNKKCSAYGMEKGDVYNTNDYKIKMPYCSRGKFFLNK